MTYNVFIGTLNLAQSIWGSALKFLSGVWGEATAKIDYGAF